MDRREATWEVTVRAGPGLLMCLSSAPNTKLGTEHQVNMCEGWNVCLQPTLLPSPGLLLTQRDDITPFLREGGPTHNCFYLPHPH